MDKPLPPLRLGYRTKSALAAGFLFLIDHAIVPWIRWFYSRPSRAPSRTRRILISDLSGSFGDTVVATAAVPPLKAAFPEAELGMLLGPATLPVMERHPDVARVHAYDHPLRPPRRWDALWQAARPAKAIIRELREAEYDVAIELFPLARNSIPLAYLAGIPTRVGYTSGGFGQLLTHPLEWVAADRHVTEYHKDLLRQVGVSERELRLCPETLPLRGVETVKEKLGGYRAGRRRMILCHPGAFDDARRWVPRAWAEVARQLSRQGFLVVFSGAGDEERELIEEILALGGQGLTLCDSLAWDEFVAAVFLSHAVVTVDTVAQHVASAFDRNCIVIGSGRHPGMWFPRSPNHRYLRRPTPCAPCHRPSLCAARECLLEIEPAEVLAALEDLDGADAARVGSERGRRTSPV